MLLVDLFRSTSTRGIYPSELFPVTQHNRIIFGVCLLVVSTLRIAPWIARLQGLYPCESPSVACRVSAAPTNLDALLVVRIFRVLTTPALAPPSRTILSSFEMLPNYISAAESHLAWLIQNLQRRSSQITWGGRPFRVYRAGVTAPFFRFANPLDVFGRHTKEPFGTSWS